jgi:hypothetical protein
LRNILEPSQLLIGGVAQLQRGYRVLREAR